MNMTLNDFQNAAKRTALYPAEYGLIYTTLGLSGESGELAEKAKKMLRDDDGVLTEKRRKAMQKELGDVLWYVASLATELGTSLNDIAEININKLNSRKTRGVIHGSGDDR